MAATKRNGAPAKKKAAAPKNRITVKKTARKATPTTMPSSPLRFSTVSVWPWRRRRRNQRRMSFRSCPAKKASTSSSVVAEKNRSQPCAWTR